jgi:LmbE family N-acetylglucosaminyl deacetylase
MADTPGPYSHHPPGTPEDTWLEARVGSDAPEIALARSDRLVVVAAHPDDETLGAGGLIATASEQGLPVDVVVLTAGERSHPGSRTHDAGQMARRRRREVSSALGVLAPAARVHLLAFPDGDLATRIERTASALESLIEWDSRPMLLAAPWRGDRHPDHEAAGEAAALLARRYGARLLEYPIWYWHWGSPEPAGAARFARLDLGSRARRLKETASRQYTSQVSPLSAEPGDDALLRPEFLRHFQRPFELFHDGDRDRAERASSLPTTYFTAMYERNPDPWRFEERWYEQRKRDLTMAILPRRRFRSAFEPACSIGLLTARLAVRCERLLATDAVDAAVAQAAGRLGDQPHVQVTRAAMPGEWPPGRFDLVVLSELGYYLAADDLTALVAAARDALTEDGCLVACHWRHRVAGYPATGDAVHRVLRSTAGLVTVATHGEEDFLLDVLARPSFASVARHEGLS